MRNEQYITKIIAASLLGDASIEKDSRSGTGNTNFSIALTQEHRDHLDYLCDVIEPVTSCSINEKHQLDIPRKLQWRLRSRKHPFFNKFHERMYGTGRKSVDPHYLTLLDAEFLAVWYMQDGYLSAYMSKKIYPQTRVGLCTNGFSYGENMNLRSVLKEKLDLDWHVQDDRTGSGNLTYRLILAPKDTDKMMNLIKDFIQDSFLYKVDVTGAIAKVISRTNNSLKKDDDIVSSVLEDTGSAEMTDAEDR